MEYHLYKDTLTQLPDGTCFQQMLNERLEAKRPVKIVMVSLDDFKRINLEYGYKNGDRFIQSVAEYLTEKCPKDCLARYNGDRFSVLFDETDDDTVKEWCYQVLKDFEAPWKVGKISHKIVPSITVIDYPKFDRDIDSMIEIIEFLYSISKSNKKVQIVYCSDEIIQKTERRIYITSVLKEIISKGKMYVNYQPILDVKANRYKRCEALFRLTDDEIGTISPAEFFPIAEENGYVIEIGYVLIDKVCQYIKSFLDTGEEAPIVSVNFSRQQLMDENLEERILGILGKYNIRPDYLAIELPENVFSVQYDDVKKQITKLHEKGIRFYLDGFGSGFMDLMHLIELPFEIIKMSKNLIRASETNQTIYLLLSAMTAVFDENHMQTLGDGIESEHLKELADLLFMNYLQGYYFSEPLSDEKMREAFLQENVTNMVDMDALLNSVDTDLNMDALTGEAISEGEVSE